MKALVIRRASVDDAAALRVLNREFNAEEAPLRRIEDQLADMDHVERVFVAKQDHVVIGLCCVTITASFCRIKSRAETTELYVADSSRRKGVGKALLSTAYTHAKAVGFHEFFVLTNKMNTDGRSLYDSMGYVEGNVTLYRKLPEWTLCSAKFDY